MLSHHTTTLIQKCINTDTAMLWDIKLLTYFRKLLPEMFPRVTEDKEWHILIRK